jgi:hypothetical protein
MTTKPTAERPRRFVRMFKPRFAPLVRDGTKRQTIRPIPKRMPRPGDIIDCREWEGKPYRSKQHRLLVDLIRSVHALWFNGVTIVLDEVDPTKPLMSHSEMQLFARADGFKDLREMAAWFDAEHGLPFKGVLIKW